LFSKDLLHQILKRRRTLAFTLLVATSLMTNGPSYAQMNQMQQLYLQLQQDLATYRAQLATNPSRQADINRVLDQQQKLMIYMEQLRVQEQKMGGLGGGPPGGQSGMGAGGPGQTMMMQNNLQQIQRAGMGVTPGGMMGGSPGGMMGGSPGGMMGGSTGGMMGGSPGGMMGGSPSGMMGGSPSGMMGGSPGGMMGGSPGGMMGGSPGGMMGGSPGDGCSTRGHDGWSPWRWDGRRSDGASRRRNAWRW
jgi:hypothetical protein